MSRVYYNEFDKNAAAWLRELIKAGHLPDGDVDARDIRDICPADLAGYTQCHFFAGIGGWPLALRLAGWPDDRPVWTGSCPCQPFSAAGKGAGFADERHLWPAWFHLIGQCRPPVVLGEQVASKDGRVWLALVRGDMEAAGYALGAADLCAAGVEAPHIRQRHYFVGVSDAYGSGQQRSRKLGRPGDSEAGGYREVDRTLNDDRSDQLADSDGGNPGAERQQRGGEHRLVAQGGGAVVGVEHDQSDGRIQRWSESSERGAFGGCGLGGLADSDEQQRDWSGYPGSRGWREPADDGIYGWSGSIDIPWRDADWLWCRDDKWRPVEPGTFPLGHGLPARVGRLRGYGNAIVPQLAAEFIRAAIESGA